MHLSSKSRHKKAQLTEAQFGPVLNWASIAQSSSQTAVIEEVDVGVQQSWNIFAWARSKSRNNSSLIHPFKASMIGLSVGVPTRDMERSML